MLLVHPSAFQATCAWLSGIGSLTQMIEAPTVQQVQGSSHLQNKISEQNLPNSNQENLRKKIQNNFRKSVGWVLCMAVSFLEQVGGGLGLQQTANCSFTDIRTFYMTNTSAECSWKCTACYRWRLFSGLKVSQLQETLPFLRDCISLKNEHRKTNLRLSPSPRWKALNKEDSPVCEWSLMLQRDTNCQ